MFQGLSPESQGKNLALTVLCVPYSLDKGYPSCLLAACLPAPSVFVALRPKGLNHALPDAPPCLCRMM